MEAERGVYTPCCYLSKIYGIHLLEVELGSGHGLVEESQQVWRLGVSFCYRGYLEGMNLWSRGFA